MSNLRDGWRSRAYWRELATVKYPRHSEYIWRCVLDCKTRHPFWPVFPMWVYYWCAEIRYELREGKDIG